MYLSVTTAPTRLDIILSSALISCCEKAGQWPSALRAFGRFGGEVQLQPSEITCGAIITSYEKAAKWQEATRDDVLLGGGFKYFLFPTLPGEMNPF